MIAFKYSLGAISEMQKPVMVLINPVKRYSTFLLLAIAILPIKPIIV